jgi:transcriptional regulator with XRE-family HTH domain
MLYYTRVFLKGGGKVIGKRIRGYRLAAKLSQGELAQLVGVTRAVVSAWENERACPKLDKLYPLANALNVNLADLVCEKRQIKLT